MKGLVLSGGKGTRLQPFTWSTPKHLIPVANRPVLSYIFFALHEVGITRAGIITGEEGLVRIPAKMQQETPPSLELTYIRQAVPLGLAHAVQTARPFLGDEDFIMVLGDNIFDQSLREGVAIFKQTGADALIFLAPVNDPRRYGIAEVKDGRVIALEEKPLLPRSNLAIMGIYLLSKKIFAAIERIRPSARGELEITDALQELLHMGGKIVPYHYSGWWLDVGKPEDVLTANRKILDLMHTGNRIIKPGKDCIPLAGGCIVSPSARMTQSKLRGPLIIGDKCRVTNAFIGPYCAIGSGSVVENARVEESILCEDVVLRNLSKTLKKSIIGENARVFGQSRIKDGISLLLGAGSCITL
ncbi:MAG: glucose-1-phosphate thymidylyltransferase [Bacillota bacterium]